MMSKSALLTSLRPLRRFSDAGKLLNGATHRKKARAPWRGRGSARQRREKRRKGGTRSGQTERRKQMKGHEEEERNLDKQDGEGDKTI